MTITTLALLGLAALVAVSVLSIVVGYHQAKAHTENKEELIS